MVESPDGVIVDVDDENGESLYGTHAYGNDLYPNQAGLAAIDSEF